MEGQHNLVTDLSVTLMDDFKPSSLGYKYCQMVGKKLLQQQEAFAEASAAHLQSAQAVVKQCEHCPSHCHRNTDYPDPELNEPQEENNRWQVKVAQR